MKTTLILSALMIVGAVAVVPSASAGELLDLDTGGGGSSNCSSLPYIQEIQCRVWKAVCALTCAVATEGAVEFEVLA